MRRFIDLHTHSTASDGRLTPAQLVRLAETKRLAALALTDHDTTAGLADARTAAADFPDLLFIAGVEISAQWLHGTMHLLGLGIDETSPALAQSLQRLRASRDQRNPKIIQALQELGIDITMEDVQRVADVARGMGAPPMSSRVADVPSARRAGVSPASRGPAPDPLLRPVLGRMHIAQALLRKHCVKTIAEAFDRYLAVGRPAYVDKERFTPAQVLEVITQAGGVPVLAHPPQLNYGNAARIEQIIKDLKPHGLAAIEAYHSHNSPQQTRLYLDLAHKHDLFVSGGSDFHGPAKPGILLGRPPVPLVACEELIQRLSS